jgi:phosphonate transport system substrate-binding protein
LPIALPVRAGASLYRAVLFSRSDSVVRTPADLVGLRAAWVDERSATGYLLVRAHLESQGTVLAEAFAENLFLGTHEDVAKAVLDGEADVGASYLYPDDTDPAAPAIRAGWGDADVRVVAETSPIPVDVIATHRQVPTEVQQLVQKALIDGTSTELMAAAKELLAADGFIAPTAEHLEPIRLLLRKMSEKPVTPHSLFPPPPSR